MGKIHKKIAHVAKKAAHRIKKIFKGFSIVELIIVIAIIAVLAGIVLVNVTGYINKSKDARVKAEISEITKGASSYYADHSSYSGYSVPGAFVSVCSGSSYIISSNSSSTALVVYAKLCASDKYWCGDSTGNIAQLDNPPDSGIYACISGSGSSPSGCGSNPSCSSGYTCYNNSTCIQCNSNGLCNSGEDCRCGDCVCTSGTCGLSGSGDFFECVNGLTSLYNLSISPYTCGAYLCFNISWSPASYPTSNACSSQREPSAVCLGAQYNAGSGWVDDTNLEAYTLGSYTVMGGAGAGVTNAPTSTCCVTYRLRAEQQQQGLYSAWSTVTWNNPNCH